MDILPDDLHPAGVARKLAERVKRRRLFYNLTQQTVAERSAVSLGSIKRFEQKGQISLSNLLKIALVLDAMDEFKDLFPLQKYRSIDDIIKMRKHKERKRGRNV